MSGHTQSKWEREGNLIYALDETGRVNRFSVRVDGGYSYGGNRVGDYNRKTTDNELSANASLILAAPDLLESLTNALVNADGWELQAYAAISKAEGRT